MPHRLATHNALPAGSALLNFRHLVDGMLTPYMIMDRSLTVMYANQAYLDSVERKLPDIVGKNIFHVFPDTDDRTAPVREKFIRTLNGETTRLDRTHYHFRHADGSVSTKCWQCVQTPYYGIDGEVAYIVQHAEDITESDKLQQRNEIIQQELDHRVKNIFSVIQAVAMLSGNQAESIEEFRNEFASRLGAMGRTHDQLRDNEWDGLGLHAILKDGLDQFCGRNCDRVTICGPDFQLGPRGAQHASLLVHEMATNAAKYGCFSVPGGTLRIETSRGDDEYCFKVCWKESGLSGVTAPETTGFGSQLFSFMPNVSFERTFEEDGLRLELTARLLHPLKQPEEIEFPKA